MKRNLTEVIRDILKKHPPVNDKNIKQAYQQYLDVCSPEMVIFTEWEKAYKPKRMAESIVKDIQKSLKSRPAQRVIDNSEDMDGQSGRRLNKYPDLQEVYAFMRDKNSRTDNTLFSRIRISRYLLKTGSSIDAFMDAMSLTDEGKRYLAETLITFENVEILFRERWYADYFTKGRDVSKFPDLNGYFDQIIKHSEILNIKKRGRQAIRKNIKRDMKAFMAVKYTSKRDKDFYDKKMFRFMINIMLFIEKYFNRPLTKSEEQQALRVSKKNPNSFFSIDEQISEARKEQGKRQHHSVLIGELSAFKVVSS